MAKKRHLAKRIGELKGQPINIPDSMLSDERPVEINVVADNGEILRKSFPRTASGWKSAIEFGLNDLAFREAMLSGGQYVPKWFRKFAIAEGYISETSNEHNMAENTPSV